MIICRSPLRISLGGGGTDLTSYYSKHGGFLIAGAIDKYVYITLHPIFVPGVILKYSQLERVSDPSQIQHPIVREALQLVKIEQPHLEITAMADIPAGTGLGSSGSFTTALLKSLHTLRKEFLTPAELAEEACHIEIDRLKEPIGKQDQYIASYGGITCFEFLKDGKVVATPLRLSDETLWNLEDQTLLFYTGVQRSASDILRDQDKRSKANDSDIFEHLHFVKELGFQSRKALECGDLNEFARLMDVHWQHKKERSQGMSNSEINDCYDYAMKNGALGGKLIGAGGGGFLMFYAQDKTRLRHAMLSKGLKEMRFRFDFEGTKIVVQ